MAALCDYDDVDRMIRDKIVFSASGKLQELLLRDTKLTLGITIDIGRAFEMTHRQVKEMNPDSMIEKVNVSRHSENTGSKNQGTIEIQIRKTKQQRNVTIVATTIGQVETTVRHGGGKCPFCQAPNHFSAKCRKKRQAVRTVDHQNDDSETESPETR